MKKHITSLILMFLLCWQTLSYAQTVREVSGKVTAAEDGIALPGVSVLIKGAISGTTTDQQGNYRINVPNESTVLVFRFIGYSSREIPVGNQSVVNVVLAPDNTQLSEVVVTALGI